MKEIFDKIIYGLKAIFEEFKEAPVRNSIGLIFGLAYLSMILLFILIGLLFLTKVPYDRGWYVLLYSEQGNYIFFNNPILYFLMFKDGGFSGELIIGVIQSLFFCFVLCATFCKRPRFEEDTSQSKFLNWFIKSDFNLHKKFRFIYYLYLLYLTPSIFIWLYPNVLMWLTFFDNFSIDSYDFGSIWPSHYLLSVLFVLGFLSVVKYIIHHNKFARREELKEEIKNEIIKEINADKK
jgi:hypothetical protein